MGDLNLHLHIEIDSNNIKFNTRQQESRDHADQSPRLVGLLHSWLAAAEQLLTLEDQQVQYYNNAID